MRYIFGKSIAWIFRRESLMEMAKLKFIRSDRIRIYFILKL